MKNFMKTIFSLSIGLILSHSLIAGNDEVMYSPQSIETDDYSIETDNIIAESDFVKMKFIITNKTGDYLYFDASKTNFVFDHGSYKADARMLRIEPYGSASRVLDAKGNNMNAPQFSLEIDGFTRVPAYGDKVEAEDFKLPPSVNDFRAGPFHVELKGLSKKTDKTAAKFEVTYNGSKIGIVDPARLGVRIQTEQEFANAKRDYNISLLSRGENDRFTAYFDIEARVVDMQFATMWIIWRDTFQEAEKIDVKGSEIKFESK